MDYEINNFGEPFFIVDIGANHNGDIQIAKKLIDKAAACGCQCVKFQSFDENVYTSTSYEDSPRREELMEKNPVLRKLFTKIHPNLKKEYLQYSLNEEQFLELKEHCDKRNIMFLTTVTSPKTLNFTVDKLKVDAIKVAARDLTNKTFLKQIARKNLPIILSTGMGSLQEIVEAVEWIKEEGNNKIILLHCIALYPTNTELSNLNNLDMLRNVFPDLEIGFSDHTLGISVPLAAIAKGACLVEKHFTLTRDMKGWDQKMSATPKEIRELVKEGKKVHKALGSYTRVLSKAEQDKKVGFRRSIVYTTNLKKGHVICEHDLYFKRPGIGVEPKQANMYIGLKLTRDVYVDKLLEKQDFQ